MHPAQIEIIVKIRYVMAAVYGMYISIERKMRNGNEY